MKEIIAFVAKISVEEQGEWLDEISKQLLDCEVIAFDLLSKAQKINTKVAIVANPSAEQLKELTNLQWVQSLWAGVEQLLSVLPNQEIKIVRMTDPMMSATMAEAVLAWSLYLYRDMPAYREQQNNKLWQQQRLKPIDECTISILGLGKLGKASALKLKQVGFSVNGWSRSATTIDGIYCFHGEDGLNQMLPKTSILVCLLPLTNSTKNLLNSKLLSQLPKDASLINFARGAIVNESELVQALESEHLKHAVLDVFNVEPLPVNNPLWESQKVTVLPHISAPTNLKTASKLVAENIRQYFDSGDIPMSVKFAKGY